MITSKLESIETITGVVEAELTRSVHPRAWNLMVYEYAFLNTHFREVDGEAARVNNTSDTTWMAALRPPDEIQDTTSFLMQAKLDAIGERTNCNIETIFIVPHIYITGSTSLGVNECLSQVKELFQTLAKEADRIPLQEENYLHADAQEACTPPSANQRELYLSDSESSCRKRMGHDMSSNQDVDVNRRDTEGQKEPGRASEGRGERRPKRHKLESPIQPHKPAPSTTVQTERTIRIPRCANYNVLTKAMKGVLVDEATRLKTLVSYNFFRDPHGHMLMDIHVEGFEHHVEQWVYFLKTEIQCSVDAGDKLRVMHEFVIDNNDQATETATPTYLEPPFSTRREWVLFVLLPRNPQALGRLVGRFPGRHRADIGRIETKTNCTVKLVSQNTKSPHVIASGNCAEDVVRCRKLVLNRVRLLAKAIAAERPPVR